MKSSRDMANPRFDDFGLSFGLANWQVAGQLPVREWAATRLVGAQGAALRVILLGKYFPEQ